MNFLKKLFGKNPDNTQLNNLLDKYRRHRSDENYKAVMLELLHGNSFLILPTVNNQTDLSTSWHVSSEATTLKLTSIFDLDGLKILGVFSDEKSLFNWTKQPTTYTALATSAVINICEQQDIGRIVINSGEENMFVVQKNNGRLEERNVTAGSRILVGAPARPLDQRIIDRLISDFGNINTIEEAYQYLQTVNNECSFVLGIKMSVISDNSKTALFNAVSDALKGKKTEYPVDVLVLDTDHKLQTARGIKNALFYKR